MRAIIIIFTLFAAFKMVTFDKLKAKAIYTVEIEYCKTGKIDTIRISERKVTRENKAIVISESDLKDICFYRVLKSEKAK